jgi:hypothetical protein
MIPMADCKFILESLSPSILSDGDGIVAPYALLFTDIPRLRERRRCVFAWDAVLGEASAENES